MGKRLHIVSFQNPAPPTYGGAIDVFFRIRALAEAGFDITLHTFAYKDRTTILPELSELADVISYHRKSGPLQLLSNLPYIVKTRANRTLLHNLIADKSPILFEGLHTCAFIGRPELESRIKIVRAHNIEHSYYRHLSMSATGYRKLYFRLEAEKLKRYESVLSHATAIAAISQPDLEYFRKEYPEQESFLLPPAHDFITSAPRKRKPFVLVHGNMCVDENILAATWILKNIAINMPETEFVIAGNAPSQKITSLASGLDNVRIVASPSRQIMAELLSEAQVTLLITFQATGMKLKLLDSLTQGAHVITNSYMVHGTGLEDYCTVADSPDDIRSHIRYAMSTPFDGRSLPQTYNSDISQQPLIDFLMR